MVQISEKVRKHLEGIKKVEKYHLTDVKTYLDDVIRYTMKEAFECQENHKHMNIKLILGYIAAIIAGAVALFAWKVPFNECIEITAIGVVVYFIFNSALMLYIWFVEKETIYIGSKNGKSVEISTRMKNYDPVYHVTIVQTTGNKQQPPKKLSKPIGQWMTSDGQLSVDAFFADFGGLMEKMF